MNPTLQEQIDKIVLQMSPPANAIGLLTADDVRSIIRQAAAQGVMAGWAAGERIGRANATRELSKQ